MTSALPGASPNWLDAMLREMRTAQGRCLQMSWTFGLERNGQSDRKILRRRLNEVFARFEGQPFKGLLRQVPRVDEGESGLPEPDERDTLVEEFEAFVEHAIDRGWKVELAVDYDDEGRPLYHIVGLSRQAAAVGVALHVVRYYLVDAISHALVEIERYEPSKPSTS